MKFTTWRIIIIIIIAAAIWLMHGTREQDSDTSAPDDITMDESEQTGTGQNGWPENIPADAASAPAPPAIQETAPGPNPGN
jgi:hypothetical protein